MKGTQRRRPEYNLEREKSVEYYGWRVEGSRSEKGDLGADRIITQFILTRRTNDF